MGLLSSRPTTGSPPPGEPASAEVQAAVADLWNLPLRVGLPVEPLLTQLRHWAARHVRVLRVPVVRQTLMDRAYHHLSCNGVPGALALLPWGPTDTVPEGPQGVQQRVVLTGALDLDTASAYRRMRPGSLALLARLGREGGAVHWLAPSDVGDLLRDWSTDQGTPFRAQAQLLPPEARAWVVRALLTPRERAVRLAGMEIAVLRPVVTAVEAGTPATVLARPL